MAVKYYQWRQITQDGLLGIPGNIELNYNEENINQDMGMGDGVFETEEEAIARFDFFAKKHDLLLIGYTIVTLYRTDDD